VLLSQGDLTIGMSVIEILFINQCVVAILLA
jgi:hypothetical protein